MANHRKYYRVKILTVPAGAYTINYGCYNIIDLYAFSKSGACKTLNRHYKSLSGRYYIKRVDEISKDIFLGHFHTFGM